MVFSLVPVIFALHRAVFGAGAFVVPSEDHSYGPPAPAALFGERARSPQQIKNMKHQNINNDTAAPSVTIAPATRARGILNLWSP